MDIQHVFSDADLKEIRTLLNTFLEHLSLTALSREEVALADPDRRCIGIDDGRYSCIEKVVNRWGIKSEDGRYNERLNEVVGRISSRHPMLQIYQPVQLLLFGKLLEAWPNGGPPTCTVEELQVFFLQSHKMIRSHSIRESGVYLYDLIRRAFSVSRHLQNDNAREYLNEGVSRRLGMLKATVDSISDIYYEHRAEPMDDDETAVLSQNVNFFYANIFAIVDCLAFVFAYEDVGYSLDRAKKDEFKKVGLFQSAFAARILGLDERLSLTKAKPWYNDIVELRHPVAHRIPLYFPEIYVGEEGRRIQAIDEEYRRAFNGAFAGGVLPTNDINMLLETLRIEKERKKRDVRVFSGCFIHSFRESKKPYHLSRLTCDLGILYHLVDASFNFLAERQKNPDGGNITERDGDREP